MGGENPYLKQAAVHLPTKKYRITYMPMNVTVEVDPAKLPYSRDGRPGSLLEIGLAHGVAIDHACGGVCACSTCHVVVKDGFASLSPPTEDEEDMLDNAPSLTPTSRLACQAVADGTQDVVVEVPAWNRNLVRE
ncbi:MAG: 2Fe-2S iron-sulfur cluster-binding protein [Planctomycetota bacterium]